jgi:hypothetical protein
MWEQREVWDFSGIKKKRLGVFWDQGEGYFWNQ